MKGNMKVKALQCYGANQLKLVEFNKPVPDEDSAMLKIELCGICGSDIHGIDGKCYYCKNFPSLQELCLNTITSTGIGSGTYPHLFGGWAEYIYVLPNSELIKLPDSLPSEIAVLTEPFTCAVGCVDRYKREHAWVSGDAFSINDTVVVYGVGAVGILMVAAFYLAGAKQIIAVDVNPDRLLLSLEFGATHILDPSKLEVSQRIKAVMDLTDGLGAGIVIEACGSPDTISEGINMLRRRGKLFELGHAFYAGFAEIDPYIICRNEIEVLGYYAYPSSNSMLSAVELLNDHKLPYEKLTKFFRLNNFMEVIFEKNTGGAVKPVFKL